MTQDHRRLNRAKFPRHDALASESHSSDEGKLKVFLQTLGTSESILPRKGWW